MFTLGRKVSGTGFPGTWGNVLVNRQCVSSKCCSRLLEENANTHLSQALKFVKEPLIFPVMSFQQGDEVESIFKLHPYRMGITAWLRKKCSTTFS